MRHDDFFDDDENLCDEDAFSDSLHCLTRSVPSLLLAGGVKETAVSGSHG